MSGLTQDPKFLALAMQAQTKMGKSMHQGDSDYTSGLFCVLDMLDMLGSEIDDTRTMELTNDQI